jgi:hypothetical protein
LPSHDFQDDMPFLTTTIIIPSFLIPPSHPPCIIQEEEKKLTTNSLLLNSLEAPLVLPYPNPNCLETSRAPCAYPLIQKVSESRRRIKNLTLS